MKSDYLQAYKNLIRDIMYIRSGEGTELAGIEAAFKTAIAHWEAIKEKVREETFTDEQEEIRFFKYIKPRFTGLIEYYTQRYQALLFIPDKDIETMLYFWKLEMKKIDRFFLAQSEFIQYYEQGCTDKDSLYFLRADSDLSNFEKARVYDLDGDTATSHDWLVSKLLGFRMYRLDVEGELLRLETAGFW